MKEIKALDVYLTNVGEVPFSYNENGMADSLFLAFVIENHDDKIAHSKRIDHFLKEYNSILKINSKIKKIPKDDYSTYTTTKLLETLDNLNSKIFYLLVKWNTFNRNLHSSFSPYGWYRYFNFEVINEIKTHYPNLERVNFHFLKKTNPISELSIVKSLEIWTRQNKLECDLFEIRNLNSSILFSYTTYLTNIIYNHHTKGVAINAYQLDKHIIVAKGFKPIRFLNNKEEVTNVIMATSEYQKNILKAEAGTDKEKTFIKFDNLTLHNKTVLDKLISQNVEELLEAQDELHKNNLEDKETSHQENVDKLEHEKTLLIDQKIVEDKNAPAVEVAKNIRKLLKSNEDVIEKYYQDSNGKKIRLPNVRETSEYDLFENINQSKSNFEKWADKIVESEKTGIFELDDVEDLSWERFRSKESIEKEEKEYEQLVEKIKHENKDIVKKTHDKEYIKIVDKYIEDNPVSVNPSPKTLLDIVQDVDYENKKKSPLINEINMDEIDFIIKEHADNMKISHPDIYEKLSPLNFEGDYNILSRYDASLYETKAIDKNEQYNSGRFQQFPLYHKERPEVTQEFYTADEVINNEYFNMSKMNQLRDQILPQVGGEDEKVEPLNITKEDLSILKQIKQQELSPHLLQTYNEIWGLTMFSKEKRNEVLAEIRGERLLKSEDVTPLDKELNDILITPSEVKHTLKPLLESKDKDRFHFESKVQKQMFDEIWGLTALSKEKRSEVLAEIRGERLLKPEDVTPLDKELNDILITPSEAKQKLKMVTDREMKERFDFTTVGQKNTFDEIWGTKEFNRKEKEEFFDRKAGLILMEASEKNLKTDKDEDQISDDEVKQILGSNRETKKLFTPAQFEMYKEIWNFNVLSPKERKKEMENFLHPHLIRPTDENTIDKELGSIVISNQEIEKILGKDDKKDNKNLEPKFYTLGQKQIFEEIWSLNILSKKEQAKVLSELKGNKLLRPGHVTELDSELKHHIISNQEVDEIVSKNLYKIPNQEELNISRRQYWNDDSLFKPYKASKDIVVFDKHVTPEVLRFALDEGIATFEKDGLIHYQGCVYRQDGTYLHQIGANINLNSDPEVRKILNYFKNYYARKLKEFRINYWKENASIKDLMRIVDMIDDKKFRNDPNFIDNDKINSNLFADIKNASQRIELGESSITKEIDNLEQQKVSKEDIKSVIYKEMIAEIRSQIEDEVKRRQTEFELTKIEEKRNLETQNQRLLTQQENLQKRLNNYLEKLQVSEEKAKTLELESLTYKNEKEYLIKQLKSRQIIIERSNNLLNHEKQILSERLEILEGQIRQLISMKKDNPDIGKLMKEKLELGDQLKKNKIEIGKIKQLEKELTFIEKEKEELEKEITKRDGQISLILTSSKPSKNELTIKDKLEQENIRLNEELKDQKMKENQLIRKISDLNFNTKELKIDLTDQSQKFIDKIQNLQLEKQDLLNELKKHQAIESFFATNELKAQEEYDLEKQDLQNKIAILNQQLKDSKNSLNQFEDIKVENYKLNQQLRKDKKEQEKLEQTIDFTHLSDVKTKELLDQKELQLREALANQKRLLKQNKEYEQEYHRLRNEKSKLLEEVETHNQTYETKINNLHLEIEKQKFAIQTSENELKRIKEEIKYLTNEKEKSQIQSRQFIKEREHKIIQLQKDVNLSEEKSKQLITEEQRKIDDLKIKFDDQVNSYRSKVFDLETRITEIEFDRNTAKLKAKKAVELVEKIKQESDENISSLSKSINENLSKVKQETEQNIKERLLNENESQLLNLRAEFSTKIKELELSLKEKEQNEAHDKNKLKQNYEHIISQLQKQIEHLNKQIVAENRKLEIEKKHSEKLEDNLEKSKKLIKDLDK